MRITKALPGYVWKIGLYLKKDVFPVWILNEMMIFFYREKGKENSLLEILYQ